VNLAGTKERQGWSANVREGKKFRDLDSKKEAGSGESIEGENDISSRGSRRRGKRLKKRIGCGKRGRLFWKQDTGRGKKEPLYL